MSTAKPQLRDDAPPHVITAFSKLNLLQRAFALARPSANSAVDAMRMAGYKAGSLRDPGVVENNPNVRVVVEWVAGRALNNAATSLERLIEELAATALLDPADVFDEFDRVLPVREWPATARRALSGMDIYEEYAGSGKDRVPTGQTRKIKFWNKLDALDKLVKIVGGYQPEKVDHTHRIEGMAELLKELDGADTGPGPASSRRG